MLTKAQVSKRLRQINLVIALIVAVVALLVSLIYVALSNKHHQTKVVTKVITKVETSVIEKEVPTEVIVEVEKNTNYTYDELYCMAVVIYNEAGSNSCTDEMQELVGYVVLNRVNDPRYPNTIREVLTQKGQYEGIWNNGVHFAKRGNSEIETKALERAWTSAKKVLENRDNIPIPENVIFQAQFNQGKGLYKQIGNTYFCYS